MAVLSTDGASSVSLCETLGPYAKSRGLSLQVTTPKAALSVDFLHSSVSPLAMVVIPGARSSTAFRAALGAQGFQNLREYVQRGGGIFGICQGFYLLSTSIHYVDLAGQVKTNDDNLGLLPGLTRGDIQAVYAQSFSGEDGRMLQKSREKASWHDTFVTDVVISSQKKPVSCFYWGGPVYHPDPLLSVSSFNLLGRYRAISSVRQTFALASRQVGEGMVLGVSPHLEVSSRQLREMPGASLFDRDNGAYRYALADQLEGDDARRLGML